MNNINYCHIIVWQCPQRAGHLIEFSFQLSAALCQSIAMRLEESGAYRVQQLDDIGVLQKLRDDIEAAVQGVSGPGCLCLDPIPSLHDSIMASARGRHIEILSIMHRERCDNEQIPGGVHQSLSSCSS